MTTQNKILLTQIAGFIVAFVGLFAPGKEIFAIGFAAHFIGDIFFYFEMKRQGCL